MGIFDKLFGEEKLKTTDKYFGEIESFSTNGNRVGWQVNKRYLDSDVGEYCIELRVHFWKFRIT